MPQLQLGKSALLNLLASCHEGDPARVRTEQPSAVGDTVETLSASSMVVYHDRENNHWFGSRYDSI